LQNPLKDQARTKFEKATNQGWDSPYFPTTIGLVYTSTLPSDRGLRDIVTKVSKSHLKPLLDSPEFEHMMEDYGDFGKDLVKAIAYREEQATYKCGSCKKLMTAQLNLTQSTCCTSCGNSHAYSTWLSWKQ